MSYDDVVLETEDKMDKTVEVLKEQTKGIRTGRATPGLVESVKVDYYGTPTRLKELAVISVPDPRTLLVKPFDPSSVGTIEKALQKSDTGLTPMSDGKMIRLSVPPLSGERRQKLVGQVKELSENSKVSLRNVRRDANKDAEKLEKDALITEDQHHKLKEEIQNLLKSHEKKVDDLVEAKRKEILEE